ncbi:MAG: hypothetical protein HRT42_09845 [Campylobacteraceae bacterium]|nr:hypothetical protein [Campylobacteraceae bacterium]
MKNKINKFLQYYYKNIENVWQNVILFIITPLGLIYFSGLEKGILEYVALVVIFGVFPWILNDFFNFFFKKKKPNKLFYLLCSFFVIWLIINVILHNNLKNLQFVLVIGMFIFIAYRFIFKILR